MRTKSLERVSGVANAYKHSILEYERHPIDSFESVLAVGLGYGLDGFGVGKYGGVEVITKDKSGESWKFLGDAATTISAWLRFLLSRGAKPPADPISVFRIEIYP